MGNFRLTLEYDGTDFYGWQRQPGRRTVQGEMERACRAIAGNPVRVTAAGRTDAGAHAAGQEVGLSLPWKLSPGKLLSALNARLPLDMAVVRASVAPPGFDARRHATSREYRYAILCRPERAPLMERFAFRLSRPVDSSAMRRAARLFLGRHDFSSFCTKQAARRGAVRNLTRVSLSCRGGLLVLNVAGNGFLHHMVRLMAGALIAVGQGRLRIADIRRALAVPRGSPPAGLAPARGLCLMRVTFRGDVPRRRPAPEAWPPAACNNKTPSLV